MQRVATLSEANAAPVRSLSYMLASGMDKEIHQRKKRPRRNATCVQVSTYVQEPGISLMIKRLVAPWAADHCVKEPVGTQYSVAQDQSVKPHSEHFTLHNLCRSIALPWMERILVTESADASWSSAPGHQPQPPSCLGRMCETTTILTHRCCIAALLSERTSFAGSFKPSSYHSCPFSSTSCCSLITSNGLQTHPEIGGRDICPCRTGPGLRRRQRRQFEERDAPDTLV